MRTENRQWHGLYVVAWLVSNTSENWKPKWGVRRKHRVRGFVMGDISPLTAWAAESNPGRRVSLLMFSIINSLIMLALCLHSPTSSL